MALQKQITLSNGVQANYWKIIKTELDSVTGKATLFIRGYLSQEARNANVNSGVTAKKLTVTIADTDGNILAQAYEAAKSAKEHPLQESAPFADAVDC